MIEWNWALYVIGYAASWVCLFMFSIRGLAKDYPLTGEDVIFSILWAAIAALVGFILIPCLIIVIAFKSLSRRLEGRNVFGLTDYAQRLAEIRLPWDEKK